jgi:hypothetical protein
MNNKILSSFKALERYCEEEGFKGYDPYDGLNSRLFQKIPFLHHSRYAKLIWIQFFKRSPVNLRKLTGIKKEFNPKAMGLFLSAYCKLFKLEQKKEYRDKMDFFRDKIFDSVSRGYSGACWGYNFDWQARAFFQPGYTPTIVASVFVADALLDAFEIIGDKILLNTARSTCDFILKDLNRNYDSEGNFAFSYSGLDKSIVFNASLLGSKLLARVYHYTGESLLKDEAKKSVAFCCKYQKEDGSWPYGTFSFHQWVDNFHTGYNLECLQEYAKYTRDYSYQIFLEKGFTYYINTFFTKEGISRYYSTTTYPIDIHSPAQLVITLYKLNKFSENQGTLNKVLQWTIDNMQDPKGFFYYQINKYFSSRIPYMRWSQSWMFVAFSTWLLAESEMNN